MSTDIENYKEKNYKISAIKHDKQTLVFTDANNSNKDYTIKNEQDAVKIAFRSVRSLA